jgi:kynurenine formamidase
MPAVIDLSVRTGPTPSEATPVEINTWEHEAAPGVFGLRQDDFPGGMGISNETVTLTTHTGTHMDAPLHYGPMCGGLPARSIDQVPLEWCIGPGVRLDVRAVPPRTAIGVDDVITALGNSRHELAEGDIVLLWTGADRLWGSAEYLTEYPGLSGKATRYLVEQGVRVIGIDAWGLDRPIAVMLDDYRRTGDRSHLWPAHIYGREREYLQLEKLANLGSLPGPTGFTVACFPVAVAGAGAGWTRVVALTGEQVPARA